MSIPSPCINVCQMNQAAGYCAGCFRTIPEITEWSRATDTRKRAILAEIGKRQAAADLALFEDDPQDACVKDA
ncbi:DUF1289 domain-containing protein [Zoogloea sp.]|uniref:DUF1289 domain-containing protein n=1 Tax=Zoogloea sp. TaxID=49181 RepID=UPI00260DBDD2|nr:DUF1289 domain-containing protein [Zoogloea sp.]MDD3353744.1 DUF1289 domain-containing protein [Zoogloea sp.]